MDSQIKHIHQQLVTQKITCTALVQETSLKRLYAAGGTTRSEAWG